MGGGDPLLDWSQVVEEPASHQPASQLATSHRVNMHACMHWLQGDAVNAFDVTAHAYAEVLYNCSGACVLGKFTHVGAHSHLFCLLAGLLTNWHSNMNPIKQGGRRPTKMERKARSQRKAWVCVAGVGGCGSARLRPRMKYLI